jgi:hypothetical protein
VPTRPSTATARRNPFGQVRLQAHPFLLACAKRAGFIQAQIRDAQPAQATDQSGPAQQFYLAVIQAVRGVGNAGDLGNCVRVAEHVRRL